MQNSQISDGSTGWKVGLREDYSAVARLSERVSAATAPPRAPNMYFIESKVLRVSSINHIRAFAREFILGGSWTKYVNNWDN